jgi:hydrophobic/amphiphilic exporter-1 (mainly G- bacteria), HAE1 family
MVPLDNLTTVAESSGPPVITHYNLFRAVEIDGSPAPGYSSGQGMPAMENLAKAEHDARHVLRVDGPHAGRD